MITRKHTAFIAVAVCVFALGALGSAKNPVERPIRVHGYVSLVVHLPGGEVESGGTASPNWGEGTHIGRFSNEASGNFFTGALSGTVTAANGDRASWEMAGPDLIRFTAGTGRFEGITGGFTQVIANEIVTVLDPNTMVVTYTYTGEGTATY